MSSASYARAQASQRVTMAKARDAVAQRRRLGALRRTAVLVDIELRKDVVEVDALGGGLGGGLGSGCHGRPPPRTRSSFAAGL